MQHYADTNDWTAMLARFHNTPRILRATMDFSDTKQLTEYTMPHRRALLGKTGPLKPLVKLSPLFRLVDT